MPSRDKRIDAYIARAPEFARPILAAFRAAVHDACPEVEETIKWGHPSFNYHGLLGSMAAFKQHASAGFWKQSLIQGLPSGNAEEAMGSFGRLTSMRQLPAKKALHGFIRQAMALNEAGTTVPRKRTPPRPAPSTPADLLGALKRRSGALARFRAMPASHQRDYVEWLDEAKAAATRARRLETAAEWIAEGKSRNWKYEKR